MKDPIKLKRSDLIKAYNQFDCNEWRDKINKILVDNLLSDEEGYCIPDKTIDILLAKGNEAQKNYAKLLGIDIIEYINIHKNSGLKVGDTVKVTRKSYSYEKGWKNSWTEDMDKFIGKQLKITADFLKNGFQLENPEYDKVYQFPFFVLEKIEVSLTPFEYEDWNVIKNQYVKCKSYLMDRYIVKLNGIKENGDLWFLFGNHWVRADIALRDWEFENGDPFGKLK